jgi:tetratricopeptide (TPR) repeat protein
MLMGKDVPPELRLLLSQATFELPIFESIDDVDRALAQLNKLDEPGPAGLALLRAVAAPPPPADPEQDFDHRSPPIRSILPASKTAARRRRAQGGLGELFGGYGSHVAAIFAGIALIAILLITRPSLLFPDNSPGPPVTQATPLEAPSVSSAPTRTSGAGGAPEPASLYGSDGPRPDLVNRAPGGARRTNSTAAVPSTSRATPEAAPPRVPDAPRPGRADRSRNRPVADPVVIAPPTAPANASARESERRARELIEGGKPDEASQAFDALVMNNPLYEPRRTDLTPEALAAFRKSQQTILPEKVQSNYERARTLLAGGDYDAAIRLAREALAILDRHPEGVSAQLREQTEDLLDAARLADATATEVIYNEGDPGVSPPRQLSRQMPVSGPTGIPPNRVGWLDIVVGKDGTVVNVKLTTPLNRYHERMIVSPAKAWQYRPATKNGKPVLCRIRVKVNLPESGTDDYQF